jgi:hypothetical protein
MRNKLMALDFATQRRPAASSPPTPGAPPTSSSSSVPTKLVPTLDAARERIYQHSLKLEGTRAIAAYGQDSYVGKILEIHQEWPGRIHVVLIRQVVGF